MSDSLDPTRFDAEVLQADGPVVVDFSTRWCAPCRALREALPEALGQVPAVAVLHVDATAWPQLAQRYNVRSVPTLVAFKDGRVTGASAGFSGSRRLVAFLEASARA